MTKVQIKELYNYLFGISSINSSYVDCFNEIKEKYQIIDKDEKIPVRKALLFIRDVFDLDIIYYDKFLRYARKFGCLIEEEKAKKNWKLKITYQNIFDLLLMPLYQFLKSKEKI